MVKVGLQLYTVRENLEQDFEGTLRKVAELGYQGVEFAGFYGRTPEQVNAILEETGLVALGAHTPYVRLQEALEEEIAFNKAIGNRYISIPWFSEDQRKDWAGLIESFKPIGQRVAEEGMVLCYHNHEFEFQEKLGDKLVIDAIYELVPASLLQVELDTGWVDFAGFDPVEYIQKYKGRLPLVHLKDIAVKEDGSPETVELGRGGVNLKAIVDASIEAGALWLIVEQDYCASGKPLESIEISMNWVKAYADQGGKLHV